MIRKNTPRVLAMAAVLALTAWVVLAKGSAAQGPVACEGDGSIAGQVTDLAGDAVEGAMVALVEHEGHGTVTNFYHSETDAEGNYLTEGVCEGEHYAIANFETADDVWAGFYDVDDDEQPDAVSIETTALDAEGIDIVLDSQFAGGGGGIIVDPGPGHSGSCQDPIGSLAGTVTLADGQPAADAVVILASPSDRSFGAQLEVETDADGHYLAKDLCAGSYAVHAWLQTDAGLAAAAYDADGDGRPDLVELTASDPDASGIDIQLPEIRGWELWPPPPSCETPAGSIAGTVRDEAGTVVDGAKVVIVGEQGEMAETETDDTGSYQVEGLCAGNYLALAISADSATSAHFGFHDPDADGEPDPVTLDADDSALTTIDIELSEPCQPFVTQALLGNLPCDDCVRVDPIQPGQGLSR